MSYNPGKRIGNLSRDVALVLAECMDRPVLDLEECNNYEIDYKFVCTLFDDTNHKKKGFLIIFEVYTTNSEAWCADMFEILKEKIYTRLNCSR